MKFMIILSLALGAGAALAQEPVTYGNADCKVGKLLPAPAGGAVQWKGKCKDGFANGFGTLAWKTEDGSAMQLQASFVRGVVVGEGKLRIGEKLSYIGTLRDAFPDGEGYLKFADGLQYEGGIRMMQREGKGTQIYLNGDVYQGQFSKDRPNGQGRMSFALGGSIEGEFRDGTPLGKVKIVYAGSGRVVEVDTAEKEDTPPDTASDARFKTHEDEPRMGSLLRPVVGTSPLPSRGGWDTLTEQQKAQFRSQYLALEKGDDPPYPENGPAAIHKVVRAAGGRYADTGVLRLNVLVGADGKAKQVIKLGTFDAEATSYVAAAVMAERYKPAMCRGLPCEMMYPLNIHFTLVY